MPMHAANRATEAHSRTVLLPSPDSAHAEIALMLNPDSPRFSRAQSLDAK